MGWLATPKRVLEPSRSRIVFLLIGLAAFAATEFGRFVFRPYVRSHGIDDFGITDSIGNLGGIVVMIFLGCAAMNPTKPQSFRLAAFYSLGFVLYEFLQPILPKGVFDWKDVYGTAVGFLIAIVILGGVWWVMKGEDHEQRTSK